MKHAYEFFSAVCMGALIGLLLMVLAPAPAAREHVVVVHDQVDHSYYGALEDQVDELQTELDIARHTAIPAGKHSSTDHVARWMNLGVYRAHHPKR